MLEKNIFKTRLADLITKHKVSKQSLADAIGTSRPAVSQFASGSNLPSLDTLIAIADYFYVSLDYLTGRSDDLRHEEYYTRAEIALLEDMPTSFIKLFYYAKSKGLKKEPITYQENWNLIRWFEEWKQNIIKYDYYQDKKSARSKDYREKFDKRLKSSFESPSIINDVMMAATDIATILKEPFYEKPDFYANMSLKDRQKNHSLKDDLQRILNIKDVIEDTLTKGTWYYVPFPSPLIEYLVLSTQKLTTSARVKVDRPLIAHGQ